MAQTIEQTALNALKRADRSPYDASDQWHKVADFAEKDVNVFPPPPRDRAHRAARAIIEELRDDRGAALEMAFHPERVDEDARKELVEIIAEIIRQSGVR